MFRLDDAISNKNARQAVSEAFRHLLSGHVCSVLFQLDAKVKKLLFRETLYAVDKSLDCCFKMAGTDFHSLFQHAFAVIGFH